MFCKNCGVPYPDGSLFCPNCGVRLETETEAAEAIRQPEPPRTSAAAADLQQTPQAPAQSFPGYTPAGPAGYMPAGPAQNNQGYIPAGPAQNFGGPSQNFPGAAPAQPQAAPAYAPVQAPGYAPDRQFQAAPGAMPGQSQAAWTPYSYAASRDADAAEAMQRAADRQRRKSTRKVFSRIGWAFIVIYLVSALAQTGVIALLQALGVNLDGTPAYWLAAFLPQYLIGFPAGYLVLRRLPKWTPEAERLQRFSPLQLLKCFAIAMFLGYTGNILSSMLGTLLQSLLGISGNLNVLDSLFTEDALVMELVFAVLVGPLMEELFFRKLIIDRVRPYGEKLAVVYSALMFGLFHGNLTQTVYAFVIGLVLGYVYLRSGKLRYGAIMHVVFNFLGSVVVLVLSEQASRQMSALGISEDMTAGSFEKMLEILQQSGAAAVGWILAYGGYLLLLFGLMIAGLVLLIVCRKHLKFYDAPQQLQPGERAALAWRNPGMIVFTILLLAVMAVTFLVV